MAAEPWGIRWERFALSSRFSCQLSHSWPLQVGLRLPFTGDQDAPLPCAKTRIHGFGADLSPGGLSVPRHHRPVSYYALFQGWLLLSQPPGCLCTATALPTQFRLGDLSRRSGLFPSRLWNFAPIVSLPGTHHGIRRLVRVGKRQAPVPIRLRYLRGAVTSRGCT